MNSKTTPPPPVFSQEDVQLAKGFAQRGVNVVALWFLIIVALGLLSLAFVIIAPMIFG